MVERKTFPVLTFVEGFKPGRPLDPNLALPGNVNLDVVSCVLVALLVVAPDILSTKLNSGLFGGRSDKCDQCLNVDDSSKIRKSIFLEMSKVMFSSRLKLDITKIGAAVLELLRGLTKIVEDQNLSGRIAKHNWDFPGLPFFGSTL